MKVFNSFITGCILLWFWLSGSSWYEAVQEEASPVGMGMAPSLSYTLLYFAQWLALLAFWGVPGAYILYLNFRKDPEI